MILQQNLWHNKIKESKLQCTDMGGNSTSLLSPGVLLCGVC